MAINKKDIAVDYDACHDEAGKLVVICRLSWFAFHVTGAARSQKEAYKVARRNLTLAVGPDTGKPLCEIL